MTLTVDGFTPVVTVTDAPTAFLIAEALRAQSDAHRRTADRLSSPAYAAISAANYRNASRLIAHAQRLDNVATEVERQGMALESADADTVLMPRILPPVGAVVFSVRFPLRAAKVHEVGRDFDSYLSGRTEPGEFTVCGEWIGGTVVNEVLPSQITCRKCRPTVPVYRNGERIQ